MKNTILATIAGVMAISAVATAAEANPWRQFRADQSSAHAAGASGHYWAGVRRGRTVGDNIAKRTVNNSVAGFEYMLVTRETLTGTLAQRLDAVGEAFRTERYFGQNVRAAVHSVFGSAKGGVVDNIYFNLRDGVITSAEAYTRLAAALTIGSDRLTVGNLNVDTATDAQIVAEGGGVPVHVNANPATRFDTVSGDVDIAGIANEINDTGGYIVDPNGVVRDSVTFNGVTYNNPGAIDDDSVIAGLEAQGYSFRVDTAIEGAIVGAINDAYADGYNDGYNDGYADGYRDGFADGVASVS